MKRCKCKICQCGHFLEDHANTGRFIPYLKCSKCKCNHYDETDYNPNKAKIQERLNEILEEFQLEGIV